MSASDGHEIGPLARQDGAPIFEEAWQAELLALAFALSERGVFTRTAWSEALGAELERSASQGDPDTQDAYYQAGLRALERLLERDGRVSAAAVSQRSEQWRRAYLATPHGQPVELASGLP